MPSINGITGATSAAVVAGDIDVALTGTVLDVYSDLVLTYAMPKMVHWQFAQMQNELKTNRGDTIVFHRFNKLKPGGRQLEGVPIDAVTVDHSTVQIEVYEMANKVTVTERLTRTSALNILDRVARQLADDYALATEIEQVRLLDTMPSVMWANEKANRAALTNTDFMSCRTVRAAVEVMNTTLVPKIRLFRITGQGDNVNVEFTGQEAYVCFVTPHQARYLREDTDWKAAHTQTDPGLRYIYKGEIGMYEGVIFIETTLQPIIENTSGDYYINGLNYSDAAVVGANNVFTADASPDATLDIHRAYLIGDFLWGFAEGGTVELRDEAPEDLGRIRHLGYVAFQGEGFLNEDHGTIIETV